MQVDHFDPLEAGKKPRINVELAWGPNPREGDTLIPQRHTHDATTRKVRANFSEDERRDLRIAFMRSGMFFR